MMKKYVLLFIGLSGTLFNYAQNLSITGLPKAGESKGFLSSDNRNLKADFFATEENDFLLKKKNPRFSLNRPSSEQGGFFKNRRNTYSSLWAFASLNYLYADLVGLMDKDVLTQYYTGTVNGLNITPNFLTGAAAFMQIPLANVFLPQIIKNERTLRWIQVASGGFMTLVQGATLFMGKPTPYYALFSIFEMAATTFITIDAIKWKTTPKRNLQL